MKQRPDGTRNESVFSLLMPVYETYLNYIGDNTDAFGIVQMASETIRLLRRSLGYTTYYC